MSDKCEESFYKLKECLNTAPMLTFPVSGEGYIVYYNAFRVRLGCVLMQHGKVMCNILILASPYSLLFRRTMSVWAGRMFEIIIRLKWGLRNEIH